MERSGSDARRSTRLSLEIPVVVTSLDPAHSFREECKTAVVNVHGCGVIVHERLESETPIMVELLSSGARKKASVVAAVPSVKRTSWLLGLAFDSPENFWQVEKPPTAFGGVVSAERNRIHFQTLTQQLAGPRMSGNTESYSRVISSKQETEYHVKELYSLTRSAV